MFFGTAVLALALRLLLVAPVSQIGAVPVSQYTNTTSPSTGAASSYWLSSITRQGVVAFGDSNYKIYRSVADYGAKGTF